jgi:GAF domain-containing protein
VPRSVKPRSDVDFDSFFAGVAELRAYLDRHLQDPERRRARLGRIAAELLKPRAGVALEDWLVQQLADSMGSAAALLARPSADGSWRAGATVGTPQPSRYEKALAPLAKQPSAASPLPFEAEGGLVVPLSGVERLLGAVWLEDALHIDATSAALLQAIAETAAVLLEQEALLQAMG